MNVKALLPLVAGLGIGGLALFLGINTLKNARASQRPTPKVKIWAAAADIPRGTEIKEEMLQALSFPTELVPKGAFKEKTQLVGRVPQIVAPGGLPILETMLAPPGTRPGIFVKPGYRAVAVKIDSGSGVDYHLEPGRFVDVVGSFKVRRNNRSETIAKTIVENAELAAVGPRLSPSGTDEDGATRARTVRAVTLFVKPEQVKTLLLAEQQGRIKLSLRGLEDQEPANDNEWVSDLEMMGQAAPEKSAPPAVAAASEPPQPSALSWLGSLLASAAARPGPATTPEAVVPPWVLRIYRGPREEVIQFRSRDSSDRVVSAGRGFVGDREEGTGNREQVTTPAAAPAPDSAPASGDIEFEPEELSE